MASKQEQIEIHKFVRRNLHKKVNSPYIGEDDVEVTPTAATRTGWVFRHPKRGTCALRWDSMATPEIKKVFGE